MDEDGPTWLKHISDNAAKEILETIFGGNYEVRDKSPNKRSSELAKKKVEINELKDQIKYLKEDMKRLSQDSKMAVERINELEKENLALKQRIESLNHFGREDILDIN